MGTKKDKKLNRKVKGAVKDISASASSGMKNLKAIGSDVYNGKKGKEYKKAEKQIDKVVREVTGQIDDAVKSVKKSGGKKKGKKGKK